MLWYKSWLDTRWRFLTGLALLTLSAIGVVFDYRATAALLPLARTIDADGPLGRLITDGLAVQRTYGGFVWFQWFRENLPHLWTLFAVLLGSGGLISSSSGRGVQFTLGLPVARRRWLGVQAAMALAELLVLALVPSLIIPLLSPGIGQSYAVGRVLVHGACLFVGGAAFFSLAFLLSTMFTDLWRPLLIACGAAIVLGLGEFLIPDAANVGIFGVMTGESYFRAGAIPWAGLAVSVAASAAMLYGADVNIAHHDF